MLFLTYNKALIPPHKDLATEYEHFSWFMAVCRARQLLAIVETE